MARQLQVKSTIQQPTRAINIATDINIQSASNNKVVKWLQTNDLHLHTTDDNTDTELQEWLSEFEKADILSLRRTRIRGSDNFNLSKFIYPINRERRIFSFGQSNAVTVLTASNQSLYVGFKNGDIRVVLIKTFEDKIPIRYQQMRYEVTDINRDVAKGQFIATSNHILALYKTDKSVPVKTINYNSDIVSLMLDSPKKLIALESGEIHQLIFTNKKLVSTQKIVDFGTILTSTLHGIENDVKNPFPIFIQRDDLIALAAIDFQHRETNDTKIIISNKIRTDVINAIPVMAVYSVNRLFVANISPIQLSQNYNLIVAYNIPELQYENEFNTIHGNIAHMSITNSLLAICTTEKTVELYDTVTMDINFVIQFELQICRCVTINGYLIAATENAKLLSTLLNEWRNYCNICFKKSKYINSKAILLCVHLT
jgi:hypothetical protein